MKNKEYTYHKKRGLIVLIIFVFMSHVNAEVIFLKNKAIMFGTILKESNKEIILKEKETGTIITVPKKEVKTIRYNVNELKKHYFYKKDKTMIAGYIVNEDAEAITIRKEISLTEEITLNRNEVINITDIEIQKGMYTFKYKRNATSVSIEGDFSGWRPVSMTKKGAEWQATVEIDIMKKNEYQYRYIVDDKPAEVHNIRFAIKNGTLYEDIDVYKLTFGLRLGAGIYQLGYADRLQVQQPGIGFVLQSHLPFLWNQMAVQGECMYIKHIPKKDANPAIQAYDSEVHNFFTCLFFMLDLKPGKYVGVHPKIGGGYAIQNLKIKGESDHEFNNSFLLASVGCELVFELNRLLVVVLDYKTYAEFEDKTTLLHIVSLGINFRL